MLICITERGNYMENDVFDKIKDKIAKELGCTIVELEQQTDKQIITSNTNKDGERLVILRKLTSKKMPKSTYCDNRAMYTIYTQDGQEVGYIEAFVSNSKEANEVEFEYATYPEFRRKGNMAISLEEVLRDVFIDKAFDGLKIMPNFPNTKIQSVVLAIQDNNYASRAVAEKFGFKRIIGRQAYEMTENEFLSRYTQEVSTNREEILKSYIEDLIQRRVLPFFKQYLPQMYDEHLNIEVDFRDGQTDGKIGADKDSKYIHYYINEMIKDLEEIGKQSTTFQDITGVELAHKIMLPREEADTLFLIHEFAHKYHWNLMKDNSSYQELKEFKREYYFKAVDMLKRIGNKANISNPSELYQYVQELTNSSSSSLEMQEESDFFRQDINGVPLLDVVFDYFKMDTNLGIDVDETLAKSVERIYIENADLSEDVKKALLTYRQDWFENHPIVETEDEESKTSKTYPDEVFFRLYNVVGQDEFIECLKNANYFELTKLRIKDSKTQENAKEYREFLQRPAEYMKQIGKDVVSRDLIQDIFQILSSEQAQELGINTKRYQLTQNQLFESAIVATIQEEIRREEIQVADTRTREGKIDNLTFNTLKSAEGEEIT